MSNDNGETIVEVRPNSSGAPGELKIYVYGDNGNLAGGKAMAKYAEENSAVRLQGDSWGAPKRFLFVSRPFVWLIVYALIFVAHPMSALAMTFTVNSPLDLPDSYLPDGICDVTNNPTTNPPIPPSGICTLRAAIQQANFTPGFNEIDVPVPFIQPGTLLPPITKPVKLVTGLTTKVVLDGSLLPAGSAGLVITGGGSIVQGFSIIHFQGAGIVLDSSGNSIFGNFVGLTPSGTAGPNGTGIFITSGSDNVIGDTGAHHSNVISNNTLEGVHILGGATNKVQNNLIGTDEAGLAAMGNGSFGVCLDSSSKNLVGGASSAERNVISSNARGGVQIDGGSENKILGNYIGADKTGANNLGNHGTGVSVENSPKNWIGQASPGPPVTTTGPKLPTSGLPPGNVISNNQGVGVYILGAPSIGNHIEGNFIGTDAAGRVGRGNASEGVFIDNAPQNFVGSPTAGAGNLISYNGQDGIQIYDTGARQNRIQANWIGVGRRNGIVPLLWDRLDLNFRRPSGSVVEIESQKEAGFGTCELLR